MPEKKADDKDFWASKPAARKDPDKEIQLQRAPDAGVPEVPGADTYTHGGSGEPPSMDPKVKALIDSGKPLFVNGQNQLQEVEPDKK
jgi:hypothetical protein